MEALFRCATRVNLRKYNGRHNSVTGSGLLLGEREIEGDQSQIKVCLDTFFEPLRLLLEIISEENQALSLQERTKRLPMACGWAMGQMF